MDKIIFSENNNVQYLQNFCFNTNVPSGVKFEVRDIVNESVKMSANGYGDPNSYGNGCIYDHKSYGDGCIYVHLDNFPEKMQKEIIKELEISIQKDFLDIKQKLSSYNIHDVEEFYEED